MKIIVGCRHGEAYKNLKNIYGGNGSALTENGIKQVVDAAKQIKELQTKYNLPIKIYISCERGQVKESGEIIKNELNVDELKMHELYKPIVLGLFNGMSRQEQMEKFPKALVMHSKWEKGEIDISESEGLIPGMQKALDYYNQTKKFIDELDDGCIHVLVGTRSDLSCILNVFKSNSPQIYMAYKYFPLDYAQIVEQIYNEDKKTKSKLEDESQNKNEIKDETEGEETLEDEIDLGV